MGIRKEFETLGLEIGAYKALIDFAASSNPKKGPLRFLDSFYPISVSAVIIATGVYLQERLVSGDSPEEIATRSRSLIRTYSKPSNPQRD